MPIPCLHIHCQLIGGNSFVLWSDWASAVISAVMTHAGRCYRSRFGGAILLTRSLLRQAASNTAQRCVISSMACPLPDSWWSAYHFLLYCYWLWHWKLRKYKKTKSVFSFCSFILVFLSPWVDSVFSWMSYISQNSVDMRGSFSF